MIEMYLFVDETIGQNKSGMICNKNNTWIIKKLFQKKCKIYENNFKKIIMKYWEESWRLALPQTWVKDHQQKLMWKTLKE